MDEKNYDQSEEETTQEQESQEDTTETEETTDDESVSEQSTDDSESESKEVDWQTRALKAEKAIEKAKAKQKEVKTSIDPEKLARIELKAEGIKDKDDQDYVLRIANSEGVDPADVIADTDTYDFVQDRLKANERKRLSAQATPKGNNRANNPQDEVNSWVRKYKKNGDLPDNNPALTSKILDALKNGA